MSATLFVAIATVVSLQTPIPQKAYEVGLAKSHEACVSHMKETRKQFYSIKFPKGSKGDIDIIMCIDITQDELKQLTMGNYHLIDKFVGKK